MTSPPVEEGSIYPTAWRVIDSQEAPKGTVVNVECRQLSDDTYQLRSPTHIITVNTEGFNLYREGPSASWNAWMRDNNIETLPRVAFDD